MAGIVNIIMLSTPNISPSATIIGAKKIIIQHCLQQPLPYLLSFMQKHIHLYFYGMLNGFIQACHNTYTG